MLISLIIRRGPWLFRLGLLLFLWSGYINGTRFLLVVDGLWLRGTTDVAEVPVRGCGCNKSKLELRRGGKLRDS